ncbi:hypothetical protein KIPB_003390 [Kipferlia bialata]|uniref:Uncharacterized protein n=1 Tax=Kipferlia bialata TaxID=797122 RepID=A0A391NJZ8_9EUKA|nr:hypothetical protein KIPB_003390 [Kipferlia bialata]|eukprot:g3390.t1
MSTSVARYSNSVARQVPASHHVSVGLVSDTSRVAPNVTWLHRPEPVYTQWGSASGTTPPSSTYTQASVSNTHSLHDSHQDDVFFHQYISALQEELVSTQRELDLARAAEAEAEALRAELRERTKENQGLIDRHAALRGAYETHMAQEIAKCKAHYTHHYGQVIAALESQIARK